MIAAECPVALKRSVVPDGLDRDREPQDYPLSAEGLGAGGFSAAETPWEPELVIVPRFVKEMIAAQERRSADKAPNLTLAQWLHALPLTVQRRERLRVLRKLGLVLLSNRPEELPLRDDGRAALHQLLERGPSDPRVRERDRLIEQRDAAIATQDARQEALLTTKLAAVTKALHAAGTEQRAAMQAAVERADAASDDEMRIARLLDAFVTCALGEIVAHDDFADHETAHRAAAHKHRIVAALDAIGGGQRVALERLLESPFAGVRASAGAHLLNAGLRRERVVPMLRQIEKEVGSSAGWMAFWALAPNDHGAWLDGEF
jgi:hypothetical protein